MLILITGCSSTPVHKSEDILSQKITEDGRTQISVLVKYAFSINNFEKIVEEKFPDIDLVQVGNYTSDRGLVEYERRLEHDDLTDIVMTWPKDIGSQYWEDRLIDLSSMPFTSKYTTSMLDTIAQNGKLYYLPGPSQIRGIVYNKTLFEEKGWEVPSDYEGFIRLCKEIEISGIRSLQLGLKNSEVLDTAFIGFNYGNHYSKPADKLWLSNFNNGVGDFADHFAPALNNFQKMIDAGIFKATDLNIDYSKRELMLFTRECAMIEDSVLMTRMGYSQTGITDEFALMPFFNPGINNDWARLYMVCYIGLNKHLLDPQNEDKYELVLKLMDYISTPEGQLALSSDTKAMHSSLNASISLDIPEIEKLVPALDYGRVAIFPELKNAQEALRKGLAGFLQRTLNKNDVIAMVNKQNLDTPIIVPEETLATASDDFTIIETGNYVTDAMRAQTKSDFALFLDNGKDGRYNGKGISARFYKGAIKPSDITRVLPDLKRGDLGMLQKVTMSGKDLMTTLEHSIVVESQSGWFYYFSGLKMEYDPTETPGNRIKKISTDNNVLLDPNKNYTVAIMEGSVDSKYIQESENTDLLIKDLLLNSLSNNKTISPSKDDRFIIAHP